MLGSRPRPGPMTNACNRGNHVAMSAVEEGVSSDL